MSNETPPGDAAKTALVLAQTTCLEREIELQKAKTETSLAEKRATDSQHQLAFQVTKAIESASDSAAMVVRRQDEQVAAVSRGIGTPLVIVVIAYFILQLGQSTAPWQNAAMAGIILAWLDARLSGAYIRWAFGKERAEATHQESMELLDKVERLMRVAIEPLSRGSRSSREGDQNALPSTTPHDR